MDPSLDFTCFMKVIWKWKFKTFISHWIIWRKHLVWVTQLGYLYTVSSQWSTGLNRAEPALWSVPSSGSAKLVREARPQQKNPYVASSKIWATFPCFPIQHDCYYSFEPADKLLLKKGGNGTWVDEYRQASTVSSCEWWQKAQKTVRHEKCVLNLQPKEQNPAPFGWRQFQKNPKPEKKKKTNNQNKNKTPKARTWSFKLMSLITVHFQGAGFFWY